MIDTTNLKQQIDFMSENMARVLFGIKEISFEEFKVHRESFEYWCSLSWWNPNWESYLNDDECTCED